MIKDGALNTTIGDTFIEEPAKREELAAPIIDAAIADADGEIDGYLARGTPFPSPLSPKSSTNFPRTSQSKATAIKTLIQYLHADMEGTVAFGDAKVDIPMLECCAYGAAMGNGGPEIRAAADYVTGSVEQDELYQAFQTLGLLDQIPDSCY